MTALPHVRSRIVVILTLLLVLSAPMATEFEAKAATDLIIGGAAEVSNAQGDNVNLRDSPSVLGNAFASVPQGSFVQVLDGPFLDETDGTSWYQVSTGDTAGYMLADFLVNADVAVSPAASGTTTARVNLRSGPGTSFSVLLVIPNGATIETTGLAQNGFTQLTYDGTTGWAATQYLSVSDTVLTGTVASGPLNLRSGPGTNYSVLALMPTGASLTITGSATSGFYPVTYDGIAGYAAAEFIEIDAPTATTRAGVNLRSGAGTGFSVILVIPRGSTVTITGVLQNGFYPVEYNGTSGFASATYLVIDGTGPVETPAWTTANLNLRSGPGTTYGVVLLIPNGSQITLTGSQQNGFYPVTYQGTSGFASANYITTTSPTPTRPAWTTANLNLRSGPSTGSGVLVVIPNGSAITVTGVLANGFYPVTFDGTSGFASANYITFTPPSPGGDGIIVWPMTGGTWEILQGYNGSSHQNNSDLWQYLYSLDLHRIDGATAGATVISPVTGTVRWYERESGGITIDLGNGYAVAMFHLTVDRQWQPGDAIQQGDLIGTVSPEGGEGYVQIPHIHLTLWQTNDGGNWDRHAAPFTGQFTISGYDFPSDGSAYQWTGFRFTP
ncbi:MAG: SH3 domain-containing protein [Thermomicrobiales bacterium]|nr:SH3 domain-containing protein [Thermomicrobiales bacterium]MCO5223475.1 SH3 domain-containing protein [Thermomicrobiales bacterium]